MPTEQEPPGQQREAIEDLPGFSPPPSQPVTDELDPEVTTVGEPSRPRVSASPTDPAEEAPAKSRRTTSSRASSSDIDEALEGYGQGLFLAGTTVLNKAIATRTKKPTSRWLATEDEVTTFGEALGRIAARRVPEQITESEDGADLLILGEVMFNYGLRTMLGLTPEGAAAAGEAYLEAQAQEAQARHAAGADGPQYGAPPPTAPPPRVVPHVADEPEPAAAGGFGASPATPPPPDVISPGI